MENGVTSPHESEEIFDVGDFLLDAPAAPHYKRPIPVPPRMAKITLILSIVFGLATAGVGLLNLEKLVVLKKLLSETESKLATTNSSLADSTKNAEGLEKQVAELSEKSATLTSDGEKMKSEIAVEKTKVSDLSEQVSMKEAELSSQKGRLESQAKDLVDLKERLAAIESTPSLPPEDVEKIGKLEEKNTMLLDQIASLEGRINVLQQRETEKTIKSSLKTLSGRILAVNQSWNFVVLDIGDKKGVLANTELLVKRGPTAIGRVRITSVEPASSIADIIPASLVPGLIIRPGDEVIYLDETL